MLYGRVSNPIIERRTVLLTKGPKVGFVVDGDYGMKSLGTEVELALASLVPEKKGVLDLSVFVNDVRVATLDDVKNGFQRRAFSVPPGVLQSQRNNLSLVSELSNGSKIQPTEHVLLLDEMRISLRQNPELKNTPEPGIH